MSRADRIALLDRETVVIKVAGLSIRAQTQLLGLNRSSLYYRPQPPSPQELLLKRRIDEIYTAHPFYGSRRIAVQSHNEGHAVNRKTVALHMREMGLVGIAPGPMTSRGSKRAVASKYPYLLKGVVAQL